MYQECSEDSKGTIVAEWDKAGKDGQRGVLKGPTISTNLLFIFFFCFYFEWDETRLQNSDLIWPTGIILAALLRIFLRQTQVKELAIAIIQMRDDGGLGQTGEGEDVKDTCTLDTAYSSILIGRDYRYERKNEFKNGSRVFGLSHWNYWVIII